MSRLQKSEKRRKHRKINLYQIDFYDAIFTMATASVWWKRN